MIIGMHLWKSYSRGGVDEDELDTNATNDYYDDSRSRWNDPA